MKVTNMVGRSRLIGTLTLAVLLGFGVTAGFGQSETAPDTSSAPKTEIEKPHPAAAGPAVTALKDVSLGMTSDEVIRKLGKPDVSDERGMLFQISKSESVQIGLDEKKAVRTIATMYSGSPAPSVEDIFGAGADVEKHEDGTIYKMVRYPDAGFYIAYSLTSPGNKPFVAITMRRL